MIKKSDLTGNNEDESLNNIEISRENDGIEFSVLWEGIFRRKNYLFFTSGLFILSTILVTTYLRLFKPVYEGSFILLIQDPIANNMRRENRFDANESALQYTQFEDIAINNNDYDSDTLIEFLKSPFFLTQIEKKNSLKENSLRHMLSITQPKVPLSRDEVSEGILDVKILIGNKKKGKIILDQLSDVYLKASLKRRQQKLNDGLRFLDKQAPAIQERKNKLQKDLVSFREKYKLIEPTKEGESIKYQQKLY